jgi:hypothetical protein
VLLGVEESLGEAVDARQGAVFFNSAVFNMDSASMLR